jgi:hypothetical protein
MKSFLSRAAVAGALVCFASGIVGGQQLGRKSPNILLIVSDDQGYADIGCCGRPELKTPNLDRLVKEGVRLTSF